MNINVIFSFYQDNAPIVTTFLCVVTVVFVFYLLSKHKSSPALASHAPSLSVSLGVFFTFFGLALSLVAASKSGIRDQYSALVGGLSIAFWTSVTGIGVSIFAKLFLVSKKEASSPIKDLHKQIQAVKNEVSGIGDHINTQVTQKLITSLGQYSDSLDIVLERSSKKLGERHENHVTNIDALNSITSSLIEKNTLLANQSHSSFLAIQDVMQNISELSSINHNIISQTEKLTKHVELSLESISKLSPEARSVFASIDKMNVSLLHTQEKIKTTVDECSEQFEKDVHKIKNNIVSDLARISDLNNKKIENNLEELDAVVRDALDKILNFYGEGMVVLAKKNMVTVAETLSLLESSKALESLAAKNNEYESAS